MCNVCKNTFLLSSENDNLETPLAPNPQSSVAMCQEWHAFSRILLLESSPEPLKPAVCMEMFTTVLFTRAKCPTVGKLLSK